MEEILGLEPKLGVTFKNKNLLLQSVVHRSYLNEHADFPLDHNERLEFLGDAVLELVVTEYLYLKYPNPEGELTNWRAALVNANSCAEIAGELEVEGFLRLSKGEQKETGKARQYILANAFEAIIGAIYLDQGWEASRDFIARVLLPKLPYILENELYLDPKSRFQEAAQEKVGVTPSYKVLDEHGPDHEKWFEVGIFLDSEQVATGKGSSKHEAQVAAATEALKVKGWGGE
jgi:ribonuclease III